MDQLIITQQLVDGQKVSLIQHLTGSLSCKKCISIISFEIKKMAIPGVVAEHLAIFIIVPIHLKYQLHIFFFFGGGGVQLISFVLTNPTLLIFQDTSLPSHPFPLLNTKQSRTCLPYIIPIFVLASFVNFKFYC